MDQYLRADDVAESVKPTQYRSASRACPVGDATRVVVSTYSNLYSRAERLIHHYTSIATLEAILLSRRLRFTRLDQFDDVLEAQTIAGIDFGAQFFASCWVKKDEEDIAQWSMYGDGQRGVRISLPDDPFEWHKLNANHRIPGTNANWHFDNADAPFTLEEVFGDGYILLPVVDRFQFLKKVCYVNDVAEAYRQRIRKEGEQTVVVGFPGDLARYKWNRWEFQQEHRFVLTTLRGPQRTHDPKEYGVRFSKLVQDTAWARQGALSQHIDLKISQHALEHAVITIGPLCSKEDVHRVVQLRDQLAPQVHIRTSELQGRIRAKT